MRCQDCGRDGAHYRIVTVAGACCPTCWHARDLRWVREQVRAGRGWRTDEDFHPSAALFADDEVTDELSVDHYFTVGGAS